MYITFNDVIGEKTIDLSYPIRSGKKIAVISMFSNNVQYLLKEPMKLVLKTGEDVELKKGVYTDKELNAIIGSEMKSQMDSHDYILRTNKLEHITEMTISLDELNNSNNLKDGKPSNALFTYYMPGSEDFTRFKPCTPQYKNLKNGEIVSLKLRITDQNNNIMTNGSGTTIALHIQ